MGKSNLPLTNPPPAPISPTQTLQRSELCFQNPCYILYTTCIILYIYRDDRSHCFGVCALKKNIFYAHYSATCFFFHDSVFEILLYKYITILFSQSSVDRQLSGFQLFTVTNNADVDIHAAALLGS